MRIRVSPGRERLAAMILGVVLGALFLGSAALWYAPVGSADFHMLPGRLSLHPLAAGRLSLHALAAAG